MIKEAAVNCIHFQVRLGKDLIDCAVLDEALEAASGLCVPSTSVVRRRSFDRFRTLIDAAAKLKSSTLPPGFIGRLVLTTADLRLVPSAPGEPPFGSSSWALSRAAVVPRAPPG